MRHRQPLPAAILSTLAALLSRGAAAQPVLPLDFQESVVLQGLTQPTVVKFSPDGRVFVAEKSGIVKVYDDLSDTAPDTFADLRTQVHNFWDRGLLGLGLHPDFPATPYVYVLYTLDKYPGAPESTIPRWGTAGATSDGCPNPPGATGSGCPVTGRLSRLRADGNVMTGAEEPLITDWCQQFPSHSIGALAFGPEGALYVSGGDGASFSTTDYGQLGGTGGVPVNPCGDPPTPPGTTPEAATAEGGALRSQSPRRPAGHPVTLDGAILRLDPETGEALPDNPLFGSADPNARRIVAHGLRNPFRLAVRPGTSEIWVGDVGWNTWEEIDRIPNALTSPPNFGWPCYEGSGRQGGYDGLNIGLCESLYAEGTSTGPYFTYRHDAEVVTDDVCPPNSPGGVSSAVAGLAFYDGGNYPAEYWGALLFADYSRDCIWAMLPGADGVPAPGARRQFVGRASNPVHLEIGPGGDLFYVDYDGGKIRRVRYFGQNQPPVAVLEADRTNGPAPLPVQFDGSASNDPDPGDRLSFAWDLDGDGQLDDSTVPRPVWTYTTPGSYLVRLRVTDLQGAGATASVTISADNTSPTATIDTPLSIVTWKVGDVIAFAGSARDDQEGTLPASALTWTLVMHHCPNFDCHQHVIQGWPGVAAGSFAAPDHEYPSWLELRLEAEDAGGLTGTANVVLQPRTVDLTLESAPAGLVLGLNAEALPASFTRRVIEGSLNTVSAPSPQKSAGVGVSFSSWSDGGGANHAVVAPAAATTYRATFVNNPPTAAGQSASTPEDTPHALSLSGSDLDGDAVTYALASGPAHGTLTGAPPAVTYRPASDYNGADAFTFTVRDAGGLESAPATVTLTVTPVNDPPVATPQAFVTFVDTPRFVTLEGRDPDGDALTFAVTAGPEGGALTGTPPGLVYTPDPGYTGPDRIDFTVSDPSGATSSPATIMIAVEVDPCRRPDVGDPVLAGSDTRRGAELHVRGGGAGIGGNSDSFYFVYQGLAGDGEIRARVARWGRARVAGGGGANDWARAGVMVRESLAADAKNATVALTRGHGVLFQHRTETGGGTALVGGPGAARAPHWIRLVRAGDLLSGYASADGLSWTAVGSALVPMPAGVYVGLVVTGQMEQGGAMAVFDQTVVTAALPNHPPGITDIPDQGVEGGGSTGKLAFTVSDAAMPSAALLVCGSSSNPELVPPSGLVFGGSTDNRTLEVFPATGRTGTATITVVVSDGAAPARDTFVLTVTDPAGSSRPR